MSVYGHQLPRAYHRRHPATAHPSRALPPDDPLHLDICRALKLLPSEVDLISALGREHIKSGLARALRAQRKSAITGHWSYDIACHARLIGLYRRVSVIGASKAP